MSLALDATVIVLGRGGEREIAAADFFVDYLTPALRSDVIVIGIRVPKLGSDWGYWYEKFQATAQAWAIVGVAALAHRSNGHAAEARIGLTNMGATPAAHQRRRAGRGRRGGRPGRVAPAAELAADGTSLPSDLNAGPDYRQQLARVLTGRALARAARA